MFAVLKTGGKQYKVAKDDVVSIEKLIAEPGDTVQFNEVLMIGGDAVTVGAPFVEGAAVEAEVLDQFKGPKTISFVKRRRKHSSQRKKGHRQALTKVRVTNILASGAAVSAGAVAAGVGVVMAKGAAPAKAAPKAAKAEKAKASKAEKPAAKAKKAAPKASEVDTPAAEAPNGPKNLLTEAKGEADDLKKISGVGPKLEGTLNKVGVYHFWQIAEWTPEDVAMMDDLLSFKGRIDRDDWIKQAAEFAADSK